MRISYLRQIAQPLAGGAPALRPSRRWPLRADEERASTPRSATRPPPPTPPAAAAVIGPAQIPPMPRRPGPRKSEPLSTHAPAPPEAPPDVAPTAPLPSVPARQPSPAHVAGPIADAPIVRRHIAPQLPSSAASQSPVIRDATGLAEAETGAARGAISRAPDAPLPAPAMIADDDHPRLLSQADPEPSHRAAAPASDLSSRRPPARLRVAGDRPAVDVAPPLREQPPQVLAPLAPIKAGDAPGPSLKIGSIEVRVVTPPPPPVQPRQPLARAATPSSPPALSRGFVSPFGLRQG